MRFFTYKIGKYYDEYAGYYSGIFRGRYYFVSSNDYSKRMTWDDSLSYCKEFNNIFKLPSHEELMFLYLMQTEFNSNCPKNEKWNNDWYWCRDEYSLSRAYLMAFHSGVVEHQFKDYCYGLRLLSIFKK